MAVASGGATAGGGDIGATAVDGFFGECLHNLQSSMPEDESESELEHDDDPEELEESESDSEPDSSETSRGMKWTSS